MNIRVQGRFIWLYDWNSTDGVRLKVKPRTAARWRRIIHEAMRLNNHIAARVKAKKPVAS